MKQSHRETVPAPRSGDAVTLPPKKTPPEKPAGGKSGANGAPAKQKDAD